MSSWLAVVGQAAGRCGFVLAGLVLLSLPAGTRTAWAQYPSGPQITKDGTAVLLQDYASLPLSSRTTGSYPSPINLAGQLGRVNFLRSEPANTPQSSSRFFVNDMNRNLYILDKITKTFTPYINFEEVFPKFDNDPGFAGGLVTFAFDPDYAGNGKFYTVHTEDPNRSGSAVPTNTSLPGLDLSGGYTLTTAVDPPAGTVVRQAVLVEWTDTNRNNSTFEGTAREILRAGFNTNIHPMGDLLFNPVAQAGGADYGNLYIAVGDGAAGETYGATRSIPQRLDALPGKILRITPDTALRPGDDLSPNGRYRIPTTGPDPNPFVSQSLPGLRKEIWAYGFRNPHRMSWDPISDKLIVNDIGLDSWEEVDLVAKGSNHGYSEREGTEQLFVTNDSNNRKTGSQTSLPTPFPDPDSLTVTGVDTPVTPVYPVAQYSHKDGDAVSSGFVYRGSLMPGLEGKYIFGDITTGRLLFADLADMIAKDEGDRTSLAAVHELQVVLDDPNDNPDLGPVNRRLFDIVAAEYARKGGNAPGGSVLPGSTNATNGNDPDGIPYGGGRADIRLALGGDGEIYVLSKSDGMIRQLVEIVAPPTVQTCVRSDTAWVNVPFALQEGKFVIEFDATPNAANIDGVTGLSNGPAAAYTNLAAIVRFFTNNLIDARNGGAYAASANIPYSPGVSYHFRLLVDIPAQRYTAYVRPAGQTEQLLASNFAFRSEQAGVSQLNNVGLRGGSGSHTVCNILVSTADAAPPIISGVAAGNLSSNSATISWSTDETASSQVEYGTSTAYGSQSALDATRVTNHSVALSELSSGRLYHYRVKSADANGNLAISGDFTFTTSPAPAGSGLTGQYYNDPGTGAHFVTLVLTRTDATVNFTWTGSPGPGVTSDNFAVRWTGQVLAPVTGNYTFSTVSDDGVRLWVNGQLVINNWTDHGPTTNTSAPIALTAGVKYAITMEFYERGEEAVAQLRWAYPGQTTQIIPQSQLFP
jgi:hypothetical protein